MKRIVFTAFCIVWIAALIWLAIQPDMDALRSGLEGVSGEIKGARNSEGHESAFDMLKDPDRGQLRGVS